MRSLNRNLIGERKTPEIILRSKKNLLINALDSSRRPMSEKVSLYVIIVLQIMFVIPFPALLLYFITKPKYIVPLFVAAAVFQLLPAALNARNRSIVFFCLCGSMLMLLEAAMYMIFVSV